MQEIVKTRRERRLGESQTEKIQNLQQPADPTARTLWCWFGIGAVLGAVLFVLIFGISPLDTSNLNWLYNADRDRFQHQIGFEFYRQAPWSWPLGAMPNYCAPSGTSIVFTDSIPLFAIFFKLFNSLLPVSFQYFGLFGLMGFMLRGGLSCVILRKSMRSPLCILPCAAMFIYMPAVLYRSWGHLALGAHWLILLALCIWTYRERFDSNRRCIIAWSTICALSVTIHAYFLPMVGLLMVGFLWDDYRIHHNLRRVLATFFSAVIVTLLVFYAIGGFVPGTATAGDLNGMGYYSMNLNALWNPMNNSTIWPSFPYVEGQTEGFNYLGLGWLMLVALAAGYKVYDWVRLPKERGWFWRACKTYSGTWLVCIASFVLAVSYKVAWNDHVLFTYLEGVFTKLFSSFRATGRLIWPAVYLLTFAAVTYLSHRLRKRTVLTSVLVAACVVQMVDIYPMLKASYDRMQVEQHAQREETLAHPLWTACEGKYERLAFLSFDCPDYEIVAKYAVDNHMEMTNGYLARKNWEAMEQEAQRYQAQLLSGTLEQGTMVVVSQDKIFFDSSLTNDTLAHFYVDGYHVIVRKDSLNWQAYADALYQP